MATPIDPRSTEGPTSEAPARDDWASSLVERFVEVVNQVRNVTTRPIVTLARALVFGLVMVCCAVAALVLIGIGLFRLLDIVLPGESWSAHLALGATCCALGGLLWSRRSP
tara:strand:+ start:1589 stop:1921 length:333 start_codon:yes stop_codon:yes gene_type:complete